MSRWILKKFLGAGLLIVTLVSCSSNSTSSTLSGNIVIDGSSTVYPMTEVIAEEFTLENPRVRISIAESGTGGGMKKFVNGEIDIVNASREIKESELQQANQNEIDVSKLVVAIDKISVVVNPKNDFTQNLTREELSHIFRQDSPAQYWSEVREGFPNELIKVYSPGTASGTFEYFTETINGEAKSQREDALLSEDDNILIRGISGDLYSIGYFGYSYYETNKGRVNLVSIDGISPDSDEENDDYILSRPLFVYFDKNDLSRSEIKEFIEFYLKNSYELASEVKFIPLDKQAYEAQLNDLELSS